MEIVIMVHSEEKFPNLNYFMDVNTGYFPPQENGWAVVMMDDFMSNSFCHLIVFREISYNPVNHLWNALHSHPAGGWVFSGFQATGMIEGFFGVWNSPFRDFFG